MAARDNALGSFIRHRRDSTTPEQVGLPGGGRRRAPGLRRTELAALAGISVEYLVRLEQGRDRHPSPEVVTALAAALRLDAASTEHLRMLAKASHGMCVRGPAGTTEVRDSVRAVVAALEPAIAVLTNHVGDVLDHTSGFRLLGEPIGLFDSDEPNLTRYVFVDVRARAAFPDWDRVADECAFRLWLATPTERSAELQRELRAQAGSVFTDRLGRPDPPAPGPWRWHLPVVGDLTFDREPLDLPAQDGQQLIVFLPADEATHDALDTLRRRTTGHLRAV